MDNEQVFAMSFAKVYPMLIAKAELIENPLMQNIRYLDKLVDKLVKGKAMKKILRR